jgi:hypothetical protein
MENGFEKYLQEHKADFEKGAPSQRVWEKLKSGLEDHHQLRRARVVRMRRISWGIAASILLCIGIGLVIFKSKSQANHNTVARNATHRDSALDMQKIAQDDAERIAGVTDGKTRQSLYHYTRLIEVRQKEMATLRQIDPDLYARSQKALIDLDMVYNRLKKQLPRSADQQKILKSLINNLKIQEQILNNQLQLLEELQNNTADGKKVKNI